MSEGIALRKAGITKPILVLHPQLINFEVAIQHHLELAIYNFETLQFLQNLQRGLNNPITVHIKFDTGLHRLGFDTKDTAQILDILKSLSKINVKGLFSHLAASEDMKEAFFTERQLYMFKEVSQVFSQHYPNILKHLCNTSGVLNYPKAHLDMVRVGIGFYGFDNTQDNEHSLENVLTLQSIISQVKTLCKGESVGYNRAFVCEKSTKIAIIPIGHNDGISRLLGNTGSFYIQNTPCRIIGNVCMDMIMIDISHIKDCKIGDKVIIFNCQKHVEKIASQTQTITYEVLTGIGQRVYREMV